MPRQIDKDEMPANLTGGGVEPPKATHVTSQTPAGIEVLYQWEPKRLYKVRWAESCITEPWFSNYEGAFDWREVPSVTTVLEVLDKPALPWWGMGVGAEGTLKLVQLGLLRWATVNDTRVLVYQDGDIWRVAGKDEAIALLNKQKLTVNHVKDEAGDRGNAVHDALEVWAKDGRLPEVSIYPEEQQLYVLGLRNFLEAVQPEPIASEVMVGSLKHGFAGRYDIRWRIPRDCEVVYHVTPKKGPHVATLKAGKLLSDLKTSKDFYETTHPRQLEAYEEASIECGYEPTDARGVLVVGGFIKNPDTGKWEQRPPYYKFVRSRATFEDFRVVLDVWRSNKRIKEAK